MPVARQPWPPPGFLWGAASSAYQVEGAREADGKGPSVWDVWTNRHAVAGPGVTGNDAIRFHDRETYRRDIARFREMGLTAYRFSVAWTRVLPDGTGAVNRAGLEHYRRFASDLREAGIEPMATLYHWDLPQALAERGGWSNRDSVRWFEGYARAVADGLGDLVRHWVTVNEPYFDVLNAWAAEDRAAGNPSDPRLADDVALPVPERLGESLTRWGHMLLAGAAATRALRGGPGGDRARIGPALPLSPALPASDSEADAAAARRVDGIVNRWALDPPLLGRWPEDVLAHARALGQSPALTEADAASLREDGARPDFLGVNYYAPSHIKADPGASDYHGVRGHDRPGEETFHNGSVRPDCLRDLLLRLRDEYAAPTLVVTENGAGFEGGDDKPLSDGRVEDVRRCRYLMGHVAAVREAAEAGVEVGGYFYWSSHDNLEWLQGYGPRFGLIRVDFDTQRRTPKLSARAYAAVIRGDWGAAEAAVRAAGG